MYTRLECPIMATIAMISDKWKVLIICKLKTKTLRFNELRRELQGVTQRVLTHQLRELEADGLVHRTVYAEVPPRVEYSMTPLGLTLIPVLDHLETWAREHSTELLATRGVHKKCLEEAQQDYSAPGDGEHARPVATEAVAAKG
ncbi:MAG TPA: helix-turn-helix domain-containing protein [Planktothrix sp.]